MRWWHIRLPIGALVAVVFALVLVSPGEGAIPRRAQVVWEHAEEYRCTRAPSAQRPICVTVLPGDGTTIFGSLTVTEDVVEPRLRVMSANSANLLKVGPADPERPLPPVLAAGERFDFKIELLPTINLRARNISGRVYLADQFSVLSPPLNLRIKIDHPTPEEIARTPIVVPTNHIQLVPRPPSMKQGVVSARFNVRHMVVSSGTNVTWTHLAPSPDDRTIKRAVKGTLCDPTKPLSRSRKCDLDPAAEAQCALTVDPFDAQVISDAEGRTLCFLSPELTLSGHYSLRLTRPVTKQPLTYYMEDALHDPDTMVEEIKDRFYHPYVTVK